MLPHLKKANNEEPEEFVSVEQEMAKRQNAVHPMTPAREMPNTELDDAGSDEDKAASDGS